MLLPMMRISIVCVLDLDDQWSPEYSRPVGTYRCGRRIKDVRILRFQAVTIRTRQTSPLSTPKIIPGYQPLTLHACNHRSRNVDGNDY